MAGILWKDWPKVLWMRVSWCRRNGHSFPIEQDYCENCGSPWFFVWVSK